MRSRIVESSAHWGSFVVEVSESGELLGARPHADDPDAAPAIGNALDSNRSRARVARPSVRRRWLERGPGPDPERGAVDDEYVELEWDEALGLAAAELDRVRTEFGNEAIFGGSYGWASAGRFHHAQSQLHRFLNRIGGYVGSAGDYSRGASLALLPHLVGAQGLHDIRMRPVSWQQIAEHTELLVTFGGLRRSNAWVVPGGHDRHVGTGFARAAGASTRIVSFSAQRDDVFEELDSEWLPTRPGTDVAVMLALVFVLVSEGLVDWAFLERCTVGASQVRDYVLGEGADGVPKTPEWAEDLSSVPAERIRSLAREMAGCRTLVNVVYAVQRAQHGEQPVFAALTLAAFLGQIGLPGGGFTHGFGSMGDYGVGYVPVRTPHFPQGTNPVREFIPCARISDMLLRPGETYLYDCAEHVYPEVRLAYWAGGNPFHHHQDLLRLRGALRRLDTLIVDETHWTGTAKHADIVFPVATTLERNDFVAGNGDATLRVSRRAVAPAAGAREEFAVLSELAARLGVDFAEGLDADGWLRRLYEEWRSAPGSPPELPPFAEFWADGGVSLPRVRYETAVFSEFRDDPAGHRLQTPSGRTELYSEVFAAFGQADVPPHASWIEPRHGWRSALADEYDLHLLCNQPSHRLHSQQDMGRASQSTKVAGREPIRLNPADAASRGIADGDVAFVRSAQGSLLAGVIVTDKLMPGVAQMHTGAWFDGSAPEIADCINGNVNVLTRDVGSSALAQACTGASVLVNVSRYAGALPEVRAYDPPRIVSSPTPSPARPVRASSAAP